MEINNSSVINPIRTNKLIPFSTPSQNTRSTANLLNRGSRLEMDHLRVSVSPHKLFEEFFIIGLDSEDC